MMRLYRNSVLKDVAATEKGKTPTEIEAIAMTLSL